MPHATLKLSPGVVLNETPVLNEAGISSSNLIRFLYDPKGLGLAQKLGGWSRYASSTSIPAITRALWAWEDTNAVAHLAVGTESIGMTGQAQLSVITDGIQTNITPQSATDNIAAVVTTVAGSSTVTITDATTTGITDYDCVYIETHIAVGGLILFGLYQTHTLGATTYTITAVDVFGNPLPAPSSSSSPVLANFTTTSGKNSVSVNLPAHGYSVGDTYPVLVSTTVGGIVIYGNYIVASVTDANNFIINTTWLATSSTSGHINGNLARYTYGFGIGAIAAGTGYGVGAYGSGGYGTGTAISPSLGTPIAADDWTLDNWGEILIACPINNTLFQPIYEWSPNNSTPIATVIANAPPVNDGVFVAMPQRQIIAWGSTFTGIQDPLLIRWCDVNNFDVWIAQVTNQAGSYRIPKGSKIIGCLQAAQQGLIWTDISLWSMQYTGPPYVYSFNEIGTGCGLAGRKAAATINGETYWMGFSQFYKLSANGVQPIVCPVWDVIFQDIDFTNSYKIRAAVNSRFGEISWFYPTVSSGGEVTSYVKYNVFLQVWDFGTLSRSAWIDQSVLGPPIGADPATLYLQQHETSTDADGQALLASFQTGWFSIADGEYMSMVDQVWPDMVWGYYGSTPNATVNLTFYVANYPGDTPSVYGPYAVTQTTQFISPRFRGRLVAINVSSDDVGSWWRLGGIRYRVQPAGKY